MVDAQIRTAMLPSTLHRTLPQRQVGRLCCQCLSCSETLRERTHTANATQHYGTRRGEHRVRERHVSKDQLVRGLDSDRRCALVLLVAHAQVVAIDGSQCGLG
jgi:hypothetical protein